MMSNNSEDAIRALNAWLDQHEDEVADGDVDEILQQFLAEYNAVESLTDNEQAHALFEQAMEQETAPEAEKLLKEAVELDPDFLDAKTELVHIQYDDPIDQIHQWLNLLHEEKEKLKADGYFDKENIGDFWLIIETRPYMRTLYTLAKQYLDMESYTLAIDILEDMIELDTDDHLGARFDLAGCYMMMEDAESLNQLFDQYEGSDSVSMIFFQAITAYRIGDYDLTRADILRLNDTIPEFSAFVSGDLKDEDLDENVQYGIYEPGTIEEIMCNMTPFFLVLENEALLIFMNQCLDQIDNSPLN